MLAKKAFIVCLIIILSYAAYVLVAEHSEVLNQGGERNIIAPPVSALQALRLEPQEVTLIEKLSGRTKAYKMAEIRPQVTGIVTEQLFEEGSLVEEGQQLYQIDPSSYQAVYNRSLADLQKAEANMQSVQAKRNRYKELMQNAAVSKQEYEDTEADFSQAQADIAITKSEVMRAKINLDYTNVYAPISGHIGKSNVTKGALVTSGQVEPLATIVLLDPIYVDLMQSSGDLMRLRQYNKYNGKVPVTLYVGENKAPYQHEGSLQFHEVTVEETTGSVRSRALFPNPDNSLLPGLFVRAKLTLKTPQEILIPQSAAIRQSDGSLLVWVVDRSKHAQSRRVLTKGSFKGDWIVASGLSKGDTIITEGLMGLRPGVPIQPIFSKDELVSQPSVGNNDLGDH